MTGGTDWRRILPPPRRRPGLLAVLVRWRVEMLVAAAVAALWYYAGGLVVGLMAAVAAIVVVAIRVLRPDAVGPWQLLAVPHRVRAAFVEAGVANREGRLPWVFWALPAGDAVKVAVGVRSGITVHDLHNAIPVIVGACGAEEVGIAPRSGRPDRATVVVVRPHRGLL
jgi:hypothetical protein